MDQKQLLELIERILIDIGAVLLPLLGAWKVHDRLKARRLDIDARLEAKKADIRPEFVGQLAGDYGKIFDRQELRIAALELMVAQTIAAKQLCEEHADIALRAHMDEKFAMQRHIDSLETKLAIMAARIAAMEKKNGV